MRTPTTPYNLADQAIRKINRRTLRRAEQTKYKLSVLGFDELNVLKEVDKLYASLEQDARKILKQLYFDRYAEMMLWLKSRKALTRDEEDSIDELTEIYISKLFSEPNENTQYVFETETLRKRDRAKESMLSVPTKLQKQIALDKAIRFWSQQVGFYADFASQDAEVQAMKDNGVKRVQRHEKDDNKVCATCRAADGEIYEIDNIPKLPHLHCRRWFVPVD